jgi:hypothetical protein
MTGTRANQQRQIADDRRIAKFNETYLDFAAHYDRSRSGSASISAERVGLFCRR